MKIVRSSLISTTITAVISALILLTFSVITGKSGKLPKEASAVITTIISCVSVFAGSFIISLIEKEKGLILGLINASAVVIVMLMISLFVYEMNIGIAGIGKTAAILISGCIGGISGVNKKRKIKF